jgi:plastocyanin
VRRAIAAALVAAAFPATDYTFSKKFAKKGTYKIVGTLHRTMRMTIVVR